MPLNDRPSDRLTENLVDPLMPLDGPELFFGLVSPVGANLELASKVLAEELDRANYSSYQIRISELIRNIKPYDSLVLSPEDDRINAHMDAGTSIRETTKRGDIFSLLSVLAVREHREREHERLGNSPQPTNPIRRHAYIFRSLKHPKEVSALRDIYGSLFFLISAYLPRSKRVDRLSRIIAASRNDPNHDKYRARAEFLVNKDEEEEEKKLGQDVTHAFPMADLFVDTSNELVVREQISRFIEILFGYQFSTPQKDEMGMYLARSVALRSADLSRQVGAVIFNEKGDLISAGCNEVPSGLGGLGWPGDADDRDFVHGFDSSVKYKHQILGEIIERFKSTKLFNDDIMLKTPDDTLRWLLYGDGKGVLGGAQILDLLEFGRPVHAEMSAITGAARLGLSIAGSTIYTTTFPCHMCARHIIAAGITRVVYIEPYPKSRVADLYENVTAIDQDCWTDGAVNFQPFVGIAPHRFQEMFAMAKRKDDSGKKVEWSIKRSNPRTKKFELSYIAMEQKVVDFIPELIKRHDMNLVS